MWENLKTYAVEVILKKIGPTAMASGIAALFALLAAHQGLLEQYGITFGVWPLVWPSGQQPSGHVILIELDTVSTAAIALLVTLASSIMAAANHHATAAVTGAPQSGNVRTEPEQPVQGGQRSGDPSKETK